jgi:hypothetical protein
MQLHLVATEYSYTVLDALTSYGTGLRAVLAVPAFIQRDVSSSDRSTTEGL